MCYIYIVYYIYINKTPDCNHQPSRVALGRSSRSPDQAQKFMAVSFGSSTCGIPRINLRKLGIQKKNMLYQDWKVLEMLLPISGDPPIFDIDLRLSRILGDDSLDSACCTEAVNFVGRVHQMTEINHHEYFIIFPYGYGSIPIDTIFRGMNIHKSQLFWCEQKGYYWFWPIPIWKNHMKNPKISEDCKQYQTIRVFFPQWNPEPSFNRMTPWRCLDQKGAEILLVAIYCI